MIRLQSEPFSLVTFALRMSSPRPQKKTQNKKLEVNEEIGRQRLAQKLTVIDRPKPKIYPVAQSSILSRVRTFMPAMQKAQEDLYKKMKAEVSCKALNNSRDLSQFSEHTC